MELRKKKRISYSIPTASMGDVAFLLILFFLVSTVFSKEKGLKMMLPEKSTEQEKVTIVKENIVTLAINPAGEVMVKAVGYDELYLSADEYDRIIEIVETKLLERDTFLVISLRASKEAPYKSMVEVLDRVKLVKVKMPDGRELEANKISLIPTSEE